MEDGMPNYIPEITDAIARAREIDAREAAVALMMEARCRCSDCPAAQSVIDHAIGAINYHLRNLLRSEGIVMKLEELVSGIPFVAVLREINERDPQSGACGESAPHFCKINCIGCIARAALQKYWTRESVE